MKIEPENSLLLIIDVQEKLIDHICNRSLVVKNIKILLKTFSKLNLPIILSEQYPKGLGKTIDDILINKPHSENFFSFEKITFSCFLNDSFKKFLSKKKKQQIIICGLETHICVLQTALDLLKNNFEVFIVNEAVGSRKKDDFILGIKRLRQCGAQILTNEMVMFELLKDSKHNHFKFLSKIIK